MERQELPNMPITSNDASFSSLGNSSLSSFLSMLLEDEEISNFEVIVDNARPDPNNSFRSLKLLEDEPKCRWNNLVRQDSDKGVRSGRTLSRTRPHRSGNNRRSSNNRTSFRRTVSDPNFGLQMPTRTRSPKPVAEKQPCKRNANCSDSDLLQMPRRLPSPLDYKGSIDGERNRNASWDASKLKKKTEHADLFFNMMMGPEAHAKPKMRTVLPTV
jgi:hypothetical protein